MCPGVRRLTLTCFFVVAASSAHAQSSINRALIGCWSHTATEIVHDDREKTEHWLYSREYCFRDDGVVVKTFQGSCGSSNALDYVLWGNTAVVYDRLLRDHLRFRISHLGTRMTVLQYGVAAEFKRRCSEADGPERCSALFDKVRP
jgi:hypothetical protein